MKNKNVLSFISILTLLFIGYFIILTIKKENEASETLTINDYKNHNDYINKNKVNFYYNASGTKITILTILITTRKSEKLKLIYNNIFYEKY